MRRDSKEQLTERAASDLARLMSEELSFEEAAELAKRREESDEYQSELMTASHMLADLDGLKSSAAIQQIIDEALHDTVPEMREPSRVSWLKPAMAACVLLGVGMALFSVWTSGPVATDVDIKRYVTNIGEQKQIVLPDASVVHLNTGSELLVEMRENERKMVLRRGEAYFDVAQDPSWPFSVDVGKHTVTVLGTEFNIRKQPDRFTLAVAEGLVAMHKLSERLQANAHQPASISGDSAQKQPLPMDQQYRFSAGWVVEHVDGQNSVASYMKDNFNELGGWRSGTLSFDETPLVDVVKELNRYSAKRILIVNADIMDLKVTAGVPVGRINDALRGLAKIYPIAIEHDFDQIVITSSE